MGKARDEAGNIWETDAQGNPVRLVRPAQSAMGPAIGGNPLIPGQLEAQPLNNQGQRLQNTHTQQQIEAQPLQNENTAVNIQQGRASIVNQQLGQKGDLRDKFNALPQVKTFTEAMQALGGAMKAPESPQGDLAVIYSFAKAMDPGSVVREGEMDMANSTASVAQRIQQQYGMLGTGKRLPPEVRVGLIEAMRQKVGAMQPAYAQQYEHYADLAKKSGFDPVDIVGDRVEKAYQPIEEGYIRAHGGTPHPPEQGAPAQNLATDKYREEYDPEVTAALNAAIRNGVPYERAAAMVRASNFNAPDRATYEKAVQYAKQNPGYKQSLAEATRTVPTTGFQRFAASPTGAFLSGAAKGATFGFADEGAGAINALKGGDYTQGRDAFAGRQNILAGEHPVADLAGQVAGAITPGIGTAAGLSRAGIKGGMFGARTPLPTVLSREGVAGDAIYGGLYGAGSDNEDRLRGAGAGLLTGVLGGAAARGAVGAGAAALSPTGGAMRPLYDMGVRPSIGQRLGGTANTIEEKLQSIPLVGDAIQGTRDRARDQFQIGLFNDALGEIGQSLPPGISVGHEPHAFAQGAFDRAYDAARTGMTTATDSGLLSDVAALQKTVGQLRPESQRMFDKIWAGSVERRAATGALSGNAYKSAVSELSKKSAAIRSNPTGDSELADALDAAQDALKASALRNSPPEAVNAMNAADRGYAKLVRIEEASRKPGGEPAEFSPSQYNTAVRQASGGVRNRAYLRGDALNTDIAALGTRLGDKVSNSGTVDRLLPVAALGAGYVEPMSAAALGGYGLINAPGIRNLTTGLMAPRDNLFFDRAAEQLRQRARLAGMFGAPAALDYYSQ